MRILLHAPFDPPSRAARIALGEKKLDANLVEQADPHADGDFLRLNPAGDLPVLIDQAPTGDEAVISPALAILEYIDDAYGGGSLLPGTSLKRAEARRLALWFATKFSDEVTRPILFERIERRRRRAGPADYAAIRTAGEALSWHLDYLNHILEARHWLAADTFSIADIAAAAHLSTLDYFGDVRWRDAPHAKDWYARVKSRPSMRPLLADRIPGQPPQRAYSDPDF